ncbi:MAG: translation elongation factor Ts [Mariprofundales bacterium]|nr:translation elongation factor Ts [Mariprofundales bacterium]
MAKITAADVKKLRESTGAGMMDCKKALGEVDGDLDAAVDYLRKKGLGAALKKAGRVAAEGMVLAKSSGRIGVVIEVNSETDFVSKNEQFTGFVAQLADLILDQRPADVSALKALAFDGGQSVEQALSQLIATIGENMSIRRFEVAEVADGSIGAYVHGGGKIGVLVAVNGAADGALNTMARSVAMHVAAADPLCVSRHAMAADAVARERTVLSERAAASGKPEKIIDKIVEGQMRKFYAESCLIEQAFVMDTDLTVAEAVNGAQAGAQVIAMARYQLGEGIEKKTEDFAAEVAAQLNG